MKYYLVKVHFDNRGSGWHMIRAKSKEDALKIREKYGISYPRFASDIKFVSIKLLDLNIPENVQRLKRRRQHHGGSVWYEENNQLKTETNEN